MEFFSTKIVLYLVTELWYKDELWKSMVQNKILLGKSKFKIHETNLVMKYLAFCVSQPN